MNFGSAQPHYGSDSDRGRAVFIGMEKPPLRKADVKRGVFITPLRAFTAYNCTECNRQRGKLSLYELRKFPHQFSPDGQRIKITATFSSGAQFEFKSGNCWWIGFLTYANWQESRRAFTLG